MSFSKKDRIRMTSNFHLELSTPGKVILFGEHSVVYNKTAIAAALDLRTKLFFIETSSGFINLNFPDVDVEKKFSVDVVKKYFSLNKELPWDEYFKSLVDAFDEFCSDWESSSLSYNQRLSLLTFFHCLASSTGICSGVDIRVKTDLAVGSGVGSSGSFSVAVSAAFLLYQLHKAKKISDFISRNENGVLELTDECKRQISDLSLSCEKIIHGTPSGIDNNTILYGSMLEFIKTESGSKMSRIDGKSMKILLVNTNTARNTKKMVEKVRELKGRQSEVIGHVLEAMGAISKTAVGVLQNMKSTPEIEDLEANLCELITLNHGLLRVLGVSHENLEKICNTSKKYGLSAKLTGAGGGGYGFVYVPRNIEETVIQDIEKELVDAGFGVTKSAIGGPGLIIDRLDIENPIIK